MPKETRFPHAIGLRVDSETLAWCRQAGAGTGETPGARLLLALGIRAFAAEQTIKAGLADRLEALAAEVRKLEGVAHEVDEDRR
jgi:hypothetical protein